MSLHSSLRTSGALASKRNVLKRSERIERLAERGKVDPKQRKVLHLPKTLVKPGD